MNMQTPLVGQVLGKDFRVPYLGFCPDITAGYPASYLIRIS